MYTTLRGEMSSASPSSSAGGERCALRLWAVSIDRMSEFAEDERLLLSPPLPLPWLWSSSASSRMEWLVTDALAFARRMSRPHRLSGVTMSLMVIGLPQKSSKLERKQRARSSSLVFAVSAMTIGRGHAKPPLPTWSAAPLSHSLVPSRPTEGEISVRHERRRVEE